MRGPESRRGGDAPQMEEIDSRTSKGGVSAQIESKNKKGRGKRKEEIRRA